MQLTRMHFDDLGESVLLLDLAMSRQACRASSDPRCGWPRLKKDTRTWPDGE